MGIQRNWYVLFKHNDIQRTYFQKTETMMGAINRSVDEHAKAFNLNKADAFDELFEAGLNIVREQREGR